VPLTWRKSSYSGTGTNDNCVEVAFSGQAVAIRDSKNPTARLSLPGTSFAALATLTRRGKSRV
jgi:Domain of unknown function (DUF397)